ncbi:type I-E CRISPR-associated endoribonuclease Cas2e [Pleomorphomonas sp. NRK KF1]|uniref:type I-E CRISPR-associated endoribonuclease Cas2e n=1 Tax=Pleomorphomonas sp. NRK KF1 TaxID=2943000 RepID=UPI0020438C66|nr:type I-E CRISPR-associated endoribonuclease Cas2e [Pleomorphomonas sp. NRK KF1]MCM5552382.1 type I-E CRISPR-associated endoribonuclease Cas2e [Pleomorphomonas sp. NRK KF1]
MTVLVTRDVPDRYRGFLASVMPEVAPGVYVSPELSRAVRERVWTVLSDWWGTMPGGSVVMSWKDKTTTSGLGLEVLGLPPVSLVDLDGLLVVRRDSRQASAVPD